MSLLKKVYASAPTDQVILYTLEILVPGIDPIRIVAGYEDITATLETGETITFKQGQFDHKEPSKATNGQQTLTFAISNAMGEAQEAVDAALEDGSEVPVNYRVYLSSDLTAPAQTPFKMKLRGGSFEGLVLSVEAGYFDLLNKAWPNDRYTADFAPGLRYI